MGSQKPGELMQPTLPLRYKGKGWMAALIKIQSTNQGVPRGAGISALFPLRTQGDSQLGIRG